MWATQPTDADVAARAVDECLDLPASCPLMRARHAIVLSAMLSACAGSPTSTMHTSTDTSKLDADVAAALAFQQQYEREVRDDPRSFLTVVDSHYLHAGDRLHLAVSADGVVEREDGELQFRSEADALLVHAPSGDTRVDERALVELGDDGRWAYACSRQEQDWRVLIHDRDAPSRTHFAGFQWFAIDPTWIVDASFEPAAVREPSVVQTSRGVSKTLYLAGVASFEREGQTLHLQVFAYEAEPTHDEPLLIPFRDATSGHESYPPGRYLEPTLPPDLRLRLDFNRATNPLCAYSEHYNCPMPPRDNTLPVAVRAGAMSP